jgi:hypothetical protein
MTGIVFSIFDVEMKGAPAVPMRCRRELRKKMRDAPAPHQVRRQKSGVRRKR